LREALARELRAGSGLIESLRSHFM
jgi:hypothetical protein